MLKCTACPGTLTRSAGCHSLALCTTRRHVPVLPDAEQVDEGLQARQQAPQQLNKIIPAQPVCPTNCADAGGATPVLAAEQQEPERVRVRQQVAQQPDQMGTACAAQTLQTRGRTPALAAAQQEPERMRAREQVPQQPDQVRPAPSQRPRGGQVVLQGRVSRAARKAGAVLLYERGRVQALGGRLVALGPQVPDLLDRAPVRTLQRGAGASGKVADCLQAPAWFSGVQP